MIVQAPDQHNAFRGRIAALTISTVTACSLLFIPSAGAVERLQLHLTWEADAFAPAWYAGRVIPPRFGSVNVNVTATTLGGRIADISKLPVSWYQGVRFLGSGVGKTAATVAPGGQVRIVVYGDGAEAVLGEASITIPVGAPSVVIVPEQDGNDANVIILTALPFSFTSKQASGLSMSWNIPGSAAGESFDAIRVPAEPRMGSIGYILVENPANPLEYVKQVIRLPYATFD